MSAKTQRNARRKKPEAPSRGTAALPSLEYGTLQIELALRDGDEYGCSDVCCPLCKQSIGSYGR